MGKSTLSKMLILKFVTEGYVIRYTTDNEIGNIKNTLSLDPSKKEIVLLDDFLGQHYLKIKESQPNEIKSLIAFVKRNSSKKIILNSRITILNEAIQQSIIFKELMERSEIYRYLINLDKMSRIEKAKIIYNHMFFNGLPEEHFAKMRENKNYLKIIGHKNYNPRIIEYVTKRRIYENVLAKDYFLYVIKKLDEPDDVWQDEFRNRINEEDRILMNTIYSLTDTTISNEILISAFNNRIKKEKCNTSINVFKNSRIRLTNSLLRNIEEKGNVRIGTINPSVNDFLKSNLDSNPVEQIRIIENAVFVEQITVNNNFMKFYKLDVVLKNENKLKFIIEPLRFEHLLELLEILKEQNVLMENIPEEMKKMLKNTIRNKTDLLAKMQIDDVLGEIVASKLGEYDEEEIEGYKEENFSFLEDIVWDGISDAIYEKIDELLTEMEGIIEIPIDEFDLSFSRRYFDISGAINSHLSEKINYDFNWKGEDDRIEMEVIKQIFER